MSGGCLVGISSINSIFVSLGSGFQCHETEFQARFLASIESLKSLCPENNGKAMMVGSLEDVEETTKKQGKKTDETKKYLDVRLEVSKC